MVKEVRAPSFFEEDLTELHYTPIYNCIEIADSNTHYTKIIKPVSYRECFKEMKEYPISQNSQKKLKSKTELSNHKKSNDKA